MNLSGKNLGKYEIIERLGQGGMAQVYKAFQPGIERFVAIKVLHSHLAEDGEFVERFQREAQSLGQLNHPNILRVIDFEEEDDTYFLVLNFIRGATLQAVLKQETLLPVDVSLQIVAQLADALDYAHENSTVHRDIKPGNIMFADETLDNPVLTDFGIARLLDNATLTMSGAIAGTPAYISPEVAQGEKADGRSDIYSLGVVLYEMVTGRPPYTGDTPLSIILKQATEPLPAPTELNPNLPIGVEKVLHRALAKLPEDRYQTAGAFRNALLAAQADSDSMVAATAEDDETAVFSDTVVAEAASAEPEAEPAAASSRPAWLPYALAGLVVAALLLGGWLIFGGGDEPVAEAETAIPDPTAALAAVAEAEPSETAVSVAPTSTTAAVPSATLPPPTEPPAPTETPLPTATPPPPIVAPNQFGELRFTAPDTIVLTVDRVPLPRPDTEYLLWLEQAGELNPVATLPVTDGLIRFETTLEPFSVAGVIRAVITEQPTDSSNFDLLNVRYEGELPFAYIDTMQSLFALNSDGASLIERLRDQAATAVQHAGFMNEALTAGNLDEAKIHAEHVVNILDGEAGEQFGDLNLDGQAQNPGDGVGVRVYFVQLDEGLQAAVQVQETIERQLLQAAAAAAIQRGLTNLDGTISAAQRVTAADTAEEAASSGDEVGQLLTQMVNGANQPIEPISDGMGGLETAVSNALALASIPLVPTESGVILPQPDPVAHFIPGRVGLFQLRADEAGEPTRFVVQMHNLPPTPPENEYAVWLVNPTEGASLLLGSALLANGRLFLQGDLPEPYGLGFTRVAVSFARIGEEPAAPEPLIFEGELAAEVETAVDSLLSDEGGTLVGAAAEYQLAFDHAALMQNALQGGDLAEGQRHAEHVVNILDGETGASFGDLNGDGQPQNPGDGVGLRVYLAESAIPAAEAFTPNQQFGTEQLALFVENATGSGGTVIQTAVQLIGSTTLEEALPLADAILAELVVLAEGRDQNGDALIDPLRGEGGLLAANGAAHALVEIGIFPSSSSTMARFTLVRADDPDKIGVVAAKPQFGAPAAGNPFYCPLLPPVDG